MKYLKIPLFLILATYAVDLMGGNPDRAGSAGATELLINPWARSSGWADANTASVRGLEAQSLNVAGLAFTRRTELIFAHTNWLKGSDININNFGLSQRVGESGVIGTSVMAMDFGDIPRTTVDLPEGGLGNFKISFINVGLSYAKEFSNSIYGGITTRIITESMSDLVAAGLAFDAGIQYITRIGNTKRDNFRFGIALRNVGPPMKYSGDGLSFRDIVNNIDMTIEQRSQKYEIPALVNFGATYDFFFGSVNGDTIKKIKYPAHRLSLAATFTSNSFTQDQYRAGVEYDFRSYLMLRLGYVYEKPDQSYNTAFNAHTGLTAGFTVEIPLSKVKGGTFGVDYSYRATSPFLGTHNLGARINL